MSSTAVAGSNTQIGGRYTAVDNGDGTFDIKDVPVFASIPAGVKRNTTAIGKEWQDKAVLRNKEREREGYLPPVHVYHSDDTNAKPIYSGKLRLHTVRQAWYQGELVWMTFGDLIGVPSAIFNARIKPGFMPYRSVEIHNWEKSEIDSLALMDTDVPFFRMPMTTIGRVVKRGEAEMFLARTPAVLCFAKKPSMAILFKFGDSPMADTEDDKPKKGDESKDPGKNPGQSDISGKQGQDGVGIDKTDPSMARGPGAEPRVRSEIEPSETAEDFASETPPSEGKGGGMEAMLQRILECCEQMMARLAPQPTPEEPLAPHSGFSDTKENTMADPKKPDAAPVQMTADQMRTMFREEIQTAVAKATAPLETELIALKAQNQKRDNEAAGVARFTAAMTELEGRNLGDDAKALLKKLAMRADAEADLKDAIATFKTSFPAEPPHSEADHEASLAGSKMGGAPSNDEAVATFSSKHQGPQALEWAKKQVAAFRAAKKVGATDASVEEWLDTNWRAEIMFVADKV